MSEPKVVIEKRILSRSRNGEMQPVATVYSGYTYRVLAPADAAGNLADWLSQCSVRRPAELGAEIEVHGTERRTTMKYLREQLEQVDLNTARARGEHPDGEHCWAQICIGGHIIRANGSSIKPGEHKQSTLVLATSFQPIVMPAANRIHG